LDGPFTEAHPATDPNQTPQRAQGSTLSNVHMEQV
jgi:hypothetical protein